MNSYMDYHGNLLKLPDVSTLKNQTEIYLRDGGETEEADVVSRGELEIGSVSYTPDHMYALDITLRCCRDLVIKLRPAEDGRDESPVRRHIRQAIRDSLPGGCCLACFAVRTGLHGGKLAVPVPAGSPAGIVPPPEAIPLGALSYLPGLTKIWFAGEEYDLQDRNLARLCLEYLIAEGATSQKTARHFETEINRYVREHATIETSPNMGEMKIHHYFNPSTGRLARMARVLIVSAGHGTGRYYLKVY